MEPESLTSSEAGFAHARGEIERVVFDSALGDGDVSRIMSGVLFLRDYAPLQANYPMEKLTARIAPSLPLGQFHYYVDGDGLPIGFCNWAWLSPAILDDVLTSGRDLYDDEFRCGDRPLFYEFLAPFGHGRPSCATCAACRSSKADAFLQSGPKSVGIRPASPASPLSISESRETVRRLS